MSDILKEFDEDFKGRKLCRTDCSFGYYLVLALPVESANFGFCGRFLKITLRLLASQFSWSAAVWNGLKIGFGLEEVVAILLFPFENVPKWVSAT